MLITFHFTWWQFNIHSLPLLKIHSVTIEGVNELKTAPWYLRILGFCIVYKTLITSDPVHVRDYYEYTCKIVAMELHWLWWKIYKYKNYVK